MTKVRQDIIDCAERHNLPETLKTIRGRACYEDIFETAIEEAGSVDAVVTILIDEKNVRWTSCFISYVSDLSDNQKRRLIASLAAAQEKDLVFIF